MFKRISLNQFAEYSTKKRDSSKLRIIRQQKDPDPLRIPWYQLAKARIKKSLKNSGDLMPILDGIEILKNRSPEKRWQKIDRDVSIQALERFSMLKLPNVILDKKIEILTTEMSSCNVNGLSIFVSPELIFRFTDDNGEVKVGAVKVHCGKNNTFGMQTAKLASTIVYKFLRDVLEREDQVDPNYCFIVDIFGDRIIAASFDLNNYDEEIRRICDEIVTNWDVA